MLLSIVIPTKNRQHTAIYAIKSALAIGNDDFEIIVHDCSDTSALQTQIKNQLGDDNRIRYFYTDKKPSMTENWNMAFFRTTGDYVCGIGDDDAVHPEIYNITKWAKRNNILAVSHSSPAYYHWPGFSEQAFNGTFVIQEDYTGKITIKKDLDTRIKEYCSLKNPNNYLDLPEVYHCIISDKLIKKLVHETGKVVDGTSVDIYSVIALGKYIDKYGFIDYPFTLRGASPGSNSDRFKTGQFKDHFKEYKQLNLPEILPQCAGFYTTAAESVIVACKNTQQEKLINLINLPELYANIAVENPESHEQCLQKAKNFILSGNELTRFEQLYQEKNSQIFKKTKRRSITGWMQNHVPFVTKIYRKVFPHKHIFIKKRATDILQALHHHDEYVKKKKIKLNLNHVDG